MLLSFTSGNFGNSLTDPMRKKKCVIYDSTRACPGIQWWNHHRNLSLLKSKSKDLPIPSHCCWGHIHFPAMVTWASSNLHQGSGISVATCILKQMMSDFEGLYCNGWSSHKLQWRVTLSVTIVFSIHIFSLDYTSTLFISDFHMAGIAKWLWVWLSGSQRSSPANFLL